MRSVENGNVEVHEPGPGMVYSLEGVVHLTGASRRSVLVYCKSGLVRTLGDGEKDPMVFDDEAIYTIRRIEFLRTERGINLEGVRMIFELNRELRRLQEELRFLRM